MVIERAYTDVHPWRRGTPRRGFKTSVPFIFEDTEQLCVHLLTRLYSANTEIHSNNMNFGLKLTIW